MKKVSTINKTFKPNEALVNCLEKILADAKKGIVKSVIGITEMFNGTTGEFVCVDEYGDSIRILGSLLLLQNNILKVISPNGTEDNEIRR